MTADEAKSAMVEQIKTEARAMAASQAQEIIDEAKERANSEAKKIVIHEKFVAQGLFNDIALIQISPTDIETSDYVKPVCLPNYEEPVAGTKCFIAGWGKTLDATSSDVLKDTEITISDVDECTANYAAKPEFEIRRPEHTQL